MLPLVCVRVLAAWAAPPPRPYSNTHARPAPSQNDAVAILFMFDLTRKATLNSVKVRCGLGGAGGTDGQLTPLSLRRSGTGRRARSTRTRCRF